MTAVEFLIEEVECRGITTKELRLAFEQAKEMEKQQKDEFTIGFAEWITQAELPLEELLETFKKEQGL